LSGQKTIFRDKSHEKVLLEETRPAGGTGKFSIMGK
jgi:hypothetical protein